MRNLNKTKEICIKRFKRDVDLFLFAFPEIKSQLKAKTRLNYPLNMYIRTHIKKHICIKNLVV